MECDTLIHIAEEDDASNTTVCSAASAGGASENVKQLEPAAIGSGDEAPLVEEEDFNYDFLHEEWSDDEDEVAVPIGELRGAHSLGAVQGKGTPQSQFSSLLGPAVQSPLTTSHRPGLASALVPSSVEALKRKKGVRT